MPETTDMTDILIARGDALHQIKIILVGDARLTHGAHGTRQTEKLRTGKMEDLGVNIHGGGKPPHSIC